MNQMEIFKNPEFGAIRAVEIDGEPWLVGKDVALALGYKNPQEAIRNHVDAEDKGVSEILTPGGMQKLPIINESGLYSLVLSSKLPKAKQFRRWVTSEVLPTIRKHGAYITREKLWEVATSPEAMMKLCSDLLAEREKNAALREENAMLEGKAAFTTCSSTSSTAPISAPPPKNWLCRNAGLSGSCWNSGLSIAQRPGMCCRMPNLPMTACSASRTTATMGIPAPIRW